MAECGCMRKKVRNAAEYKKLIHRLNRIEGQVRGIRNMVEENAYCVDILHQAAAVSAAMNSFSTELLEEHVRTCVTQDIHAGKEDAVDELLSILRKIMK